MTEAEPERNAVDCYNERKVGARSLDFFQRESHNLTDWKSLFKHPPSNIRFRRNSNSREPKRTITIPCMTEERSEKPKQHIIPPPKRKSSKSSISSDSGRVEEGVKEPPVQLLKLQDPCGSAGSSNCSMSSSPTSQTSTLGEDEEGDGEIKDGGEEYFG